MNRTIHITAIFILAALTALASVAQASRIIAQNEEAFEMGLDDVTLPGNAAGTVTFKTCDTCTTQSMRVTATTVYQVNGQMVTLEDFSAAAADFRKRQNGAYNTAVYLFFDIKSHIVTRLGLDYLG